MPDISCRTCGGSLVNSSLCPNCKKITQQICNICGSKTKKQIHSDCLYLELSQTKHGMMTSLLARTKSKRENTKQKNAEKTHSLRNLLLVLGVVGFFVLGFTTANYFVPIQNQTSESPIITNISQQSSQNHDYTPHRSFNNCLAYGSGQSMTVTCPTVYGYVYKAILTAPQKLVSEFSDQVFSIRGISIVEYSDGSVVLQYHKNLYTTGFFGN